MAELGWLITDHTAYAIVGGVPTEVDVTGTMLAGLPPGDYTTEEAQAALEKLRPKWLVDLLGKFDPDQPRDEGGKWTSGGGGAGGATDQSPAQSSAPSENQRKALYRYSEAAGEINSHLRFGMSVSDAELEQINHMNEFLDNQSLAEEIEVWRGVSGDFAEHVASLNVGDILEDKGFTSTSSNAGVAERFATQVYDDGEGGGTMLITLPKGSRAAEISPYTELSGESEVLIARNSRLRYDGRVAGNHLFTLMPH